MITGLAGLVLCFVVVPSVVALVLGLVAARQIRRSGGRTTGLAAARIGWITGLVGTVAGVAFIVAAVSGAFDDGDVAVFDLDPGDCLDIDPVDEERLESLPVVDCDEPHNGEVIATGRLNPDRESEYPDDVFGTVDPICQAAFLREVDGDALGMVEPVSIAPDEDAWEVGGPYTCLAVGPTDSLTESVLD
jgi:hypothetical protein